METRDAKNRRQDLFQSLTAEIQSSAEIENQIEAVLGDEGNSGSGKQA